MGLGELHLKNFRLFESFDFTPDPDAITVLLSPNGTGKTSVLEAVTMLATASSFRTTAAADVVRNTTDLAEVHGVASVAERRVQIDLTINRGVRTTKRMLVNGQRPTSRRDLAEALPLTLFTPEGVSLVRGGPENRRDYITTLEQDIDPRSAELHERFARVLTQRNSLLRSFGGEMPTSAEREQLAVWNDELVPAAELVVAQRQRLLKTMQAPASALYQALSGSTTTLDLTYECSWHGDLAIALDGALRDDVHRGYTTLGPHRDDVRIELSGRDTRRQASQGEQRSAALALRLAGHGLVTTTRNVQPLLLLDDVFSELDPMRSAALLDLLPKGQTLVTTASPLPPTMEPASVVNVEKVARGF